jgi:hypothetical protein
LPSNGINLSTLWKEDADLDVASHLHLRRQYYEQVLMAYTIGQI